MFSLVQCEKLIPHKWTDISGVVDSQKCNFNQYGLEDQLCLSVVFIAF